MNKTSAIGRKLTALLFVCLMGGALPVMAAKPPPLPCSLGDVSSSVACIGAVNANDSASWLNDNNAFGFDDWIFAERDEGVPVETIDVGLTITPPVTGNALSGTWSLDSDIFSRYEHVVLSLKAGNAFSLYLLSGDFTSGSWNIEDWTGNGLSHSSVYVRNLTAVPLPAAVWLLGSGLLGLMTLTRRRKAT